jgi:hypothetical protein
MTLDENPKVSIRRRGCGCFMAIFGVLLLLFGSLFLLTFVSGVTSSDERVADNTAAYIFLLAVTVLPGVYLIRRSRRQVRTASKQPGDTGRQLQPPVESHSAAPSNSMEADEQPSAAPATASLNATSLLITRIPESGGHPYTVLLDDKPLGKVSPDSTRRFEIPTGMHWVTVKTRKDSSNTQVIEPNQGDQIILRCGPAAGDQIDDLGRKMEGIILELVG